MRKVCCKSSYMLQNVITTLHYAGSVHTGLRCHTCLMSAYTRCERNNLFSFKENLLMVWPRARRRFNVALKWRRPRVQRGGVWSSCICGEWKERKTTQQHGQIRLTETIFKNLGQSPGRNLCLSHSLTSAPLALFFTPFLLHPFPLTLSLSSHSLLTTLPPRPLYMSPCPYFIHSFCRSMSRPGRVPGHRRSSFCRLPV